MIQMQNDWQSVRLLQNTITDAAEDQANEHRRSHTFAVGDKVLVSMNPIVREQLIPGFEGKLAPKAAGPYIITHQITRNTFRLQLPPTVGPLFHPVFHSSVLIPYHERHQFQIAPLPEVVLDDPEIPPTSPVAPS